MSIDDIFYGKQSAVFLPPRHLTEPSAWIGHIPFAQWLVSVMKPATVVELGSHYGHSFFAFCNAVSAEGLNTQCYAVDTWEGDSHTGVYGDEVYNAVENFISENFCSIAHLLRMTFDEAVNKFEDQSVDLLHIDGFHSYEAVSHDFFSWLPKLSDRAIVLFHDIAVQKNGFGVWKFWDEVKQDHTSFEFLHSHGLGVLVVGNKVNDDIASWLNVVVGGSDDGFYKKLFTELGRVSELVQFCELRLGLLDKADEGSQEASRLGLELLQKESEIAQWKMELKALRDELLQANELLRAVYSSKTWRLFSPIRRVHHVLKSLKLAYSHDRARRILAKSLRSIRYIPAAISRFGVVGLLRTTHSVYRQCGVRGLLRAVERFAKQGTSLLVGNQGLVQTDLSAKTLWKVALGRKRVIYVVNEHDRMTQIYRVYNYAEALAAKGFETNILVDSQLSSIDDIDGDLLILSRVVCHGLVEQLVKRFKVAGRPVIFDVDDLMFDRSHLEHIPHYGRLPEEQKSGLRNLVDGLAETLELANYVTVSTHPLRKEVEARGKAAFVVPNNNGLSQQQLAGQLMAEKAAGGNSKPVIGYFSGTKTHDEDFQQCAGALVEILKKHSNVEMLFVGEIAIPDVFMQFCDQVRKLPLMIHDEMLKVLSGIDINLSPLSPGSLFTDCKSELKVFEAAMFAIPTVASPTASLSSVIRTASNGFLAANHQEWVEAIDTLLNEPGLRRSVGERAKADIGKRFSINTTVNEAGAVYEAAIQGSIRDEQVLCSVPNKEAAPCISIVSILYNKANEVRYFLEGLSRQDFGGQFEIVLIDDNSPDDSVEVVKDFLQHNKGNSNRDLDVRFIKNKVNVGNCESRNIGIAQSRGDVVIVIDADCMFNRSFLSEHYSAHSAGDCDVAIGPINIETNDESPLSVLAMHDANMSLAVSQSLPQDPINLDSFVNCITRNFSISKKFLAEKMGGVLFDNDFSYSASPESGFGWEDVEMGYRVYSASGRVKFLERTASIHVSHPSSANELEKPARSLRNFKRLFEKHPDLLCVSRQWSIYTYNAIVGWGRSVVGKGFEDNKDFKYLEPKFRKYAKTPISVDRSRTLKILTHRWHVPHQYELYKSGHEVTLVTGAGTGLCDSWEYEKRPLPSNAKMLNVADINPAEYDLAIMHFDENLLNPGLCNGMVPMDWGETFDWFIREINLPKVAICHGTPQFKGQYNSGYSGTDLGTILEGERQKTIDYLKDILVVCNSHQARAEWGFLQSQTIWHGFSPHDYPVGSHEKGVLVMLGAAMRNRPYYNGLGVVEEIKKRLGSELTITSHKTSSPPDVYKKSLPEWAIAKYQNYVREVGEYSVYLNPTVRSPMPRSRGEAMMAGLVSVSLRNHDVDLFIKNGVNGFFADTAAELSDYLHWLDRNDSGREKMARASRQTALNIFNQDKYLAEWSSLLNTLVN